MTKTENLNLPQWEAADPIRREDFNAAMERIDSIVTVGSYTGNGAELSAGGLHVELGFRPRFVIISKGLEKYSTVHPSTMIATEHSTDTAAGYVAFDDTGFTVGLQADVGVYAMRPNETGLIYAFVAFG